ncbi:Mov34/MPN/PAD-1 family protein [Paenibacillus beijingensis]
MIEICRRSLPEEACGVLATTGGGAGEAVSTTNAPARIDTVIPIANCHPMAKNSFRFCPEDWIDAYYSMQKNRQQLVGFFHSHPATPPLPSTRDLNGLLWTTASAAKGRLSYWIISLRQPLEPKAAAYEIAGNRFIPLMLA